MANGKTHVAVGALAGGSYAFFNTGEKDQGQEFIHVLAGVAGGWIGSKLPDCLEPATSPCHRKLAHSYTMAIGTLAFAPDWLLRLEKHSRRCVEGYHSAASRTVDPHEKIRCDMAIVFWKLLVPFLRGVFAGYVSHLALDAMTPRGLPICF